MITYSFSTSTYYSLNCSNIKNTQTVRDRLELRGRHQSLVSYKIACHPMRYLHVPSTPCCLSTIRSPLAQDGSQSWSWFEFGASPASMCLEHFIPNCCHYMVGGWWKLQEVESSWRKEVSRGDPALASSTISSEICCGVRSSALWLPLWTLP